MEEMRDERVVDTGSPRHGRGGGLLQRPAGRVDENVVRQLATAAAITAAVVAAPRRVGDCHGAGRGAARRAGCVARALLGSYQRDRSVALAVLQEVAHVVSLMALGGGWLRRYAGRRRPAGQVGSEET